MLREALNFRVRELFEKINSECIWCTINCKIPVGKVVFFRGFFSIPCCAKWNQEISRNRACVSAYHVVQTLYCVCNLRKYSALFRRARYRHTMDYWLETAYISMLMLVTTSGYAGTAFRCHGRVRKFKTIFTGEVMTSFNHVMIPIWDNNWFQTSS